MNRCDLLYYSSFFHFFFLFGLGRRSLMRSGLPFGLFASRSSLLYTVHFDSSALKYYIDDRSVEASYRTVVL